MARLRESETIIPKIYRRKYEDLGMFFWVEAQIKIVPTCRTEQSICSYYKFIGIDDYNLESAVTMVSQMRGEFIDLYKNENSEKTC